MHKVEELNTAWCILQTFSECYFIACWVPSCCSHHHSVGDYAPLGSGLFLPFVSLPLPVFVGLSSFLPFAFHSLQKLTVPIPVGFIPTLLPIPSAKILSKETATAHINLGIDASIINTMTQRWQVFTCLQTTQNWLF